MFTALRYGACGRFDHVGRDAAAGDLAPVGLDGDRHRAQRVGAAGDRRDLEVADRCRAMPVASEIAAIAASIMPSPVPFASILPSSWPSTTRAVGFAAVPPCSSSSWTVKRWTSVGAELLGDDRLEVGFGDLDLLVGELLEAHERAR